MNLQEKIVEISRISSVSPVTTSHFAGRRSTNMYFSENDIPAKTLETAKKCYISKKEKL